MYIIQHIPSLKSKYICIYAVDETWVPTYFLHSELSSSTLSCLEASLVAQCEGPTFTYARATKMWPEQPQYVESSCNVGAVEQPQNAAKQSERVASSQNLWGQSQYNWSSHSVTGVAAMWLEWPQYDRSSDIVIKAATLDWEQLQCIWCSNSVSRMTTLCVYESQ
jgi:hypothetical protein